MKRSNKGLKLPAEIVTDAEVQDLIRACSGRAPTGVRNRALIVILYRGGLRVSEALGLKPRDIDEPAGTVRIRHGKGNRARTVGLDPGAFAVVARWLDVRRARGINGHAPIFSTLHGQPLAPAYVRGLFKRLAQKAGIEKRVHPHGLRHTHAAQLAREGVAVHVIQKQLGHSSLATTSRYLDHLEPREVIEAMQQRNWEVS